MYKYTSVGKDLLKLLLGHNQSPSGNFADITTLPYLKENDSQVLILALFIGFNILNLLPVLVQP